MVHQSCEMAPPIHLGMWAMAIARVVLFREVSSVQGISLKRGSTVYTCTP